MWPDDMPTPGTREFVRWFDAQDPDTRNQIIFDFGLSDANQPVMGNVGGGQMLPEISSQGFGMLDQMAPPPVINSKGVVQPPGTEQRQKQLNLFQDENSLMTDNVLAAIAGQFSPTAFTPTLRPQGNPVTQGGLRQLQSLANTGGWEGFMAQQMLPTEYGGGGMSASQAKGALIKAIRAPDTADQTALDLREELRGSLTPRYETSARPGDTPVNKDLSTAQGIANAYDLTDLDAVARQWQSDLAKDPIAAYTDPQTGLSYAGVTSANTPTMDWFDKYGLPYANKSYADPDQIAAFQDATAPWAPGQSQELENTEKQGLLDANAAARGELGAANSQLDILRKAYEQATGSGLLKPATQPTTYTMGVPRPPAAAGTPASPVPTTGLQVAATDTAGKPTLYRTKTGALITPEGMSAVGNIQTPQGTRTSDVPNAQPASPDFTTKTIPGTPGRENFLMNMDAQGNALGLAVNQTIPSGDTGNVKLGDNIKGRANFNFGAAGSTIPGQDWGALGEMLPFLKQVNPDRKVMTAADLGTAQERVALAHKAAAATVPGLQRATESSPTSMARQLARARMMGLAATGRTPLSDTLAGRMMAARSAGIYG